MNFGNSKIQNYEIAFLKECVDAGADGFRFDGAKHIEVPNDYENASSNFWSNVLGATTSYAKSSRGFTPYYYGEILDSTGGGQSIVNQYTNYMSVTCNTVSDNIRSQVNSGNLDGTITISDATEIQYHISEYKALTGDNVIAADTDKNGTINIKDATAIQYYLVGLIESAGHCGEYAGGTPATQPTTQPATQATQPTTFPSGNYLYYKNTNGWGTVNAYYWSDDNTSLTKWPGVDMESVGNNVYRTKYPSAATYIIFSNNGSNQTSTITLSGANKIYKNGSWSTYNG